jgi:hypothetical protein
MPASPDDRAGLIAEAQALKGLINSVPVPGTTIDKAPAIRSPGTVGQFQIAATARESFPYSAPMRKLIATYLKRVSELLSESGDYDVELTGTGPNALSPMLRVAVRSSKKRG